MTTKDYQEQSALRIFLSYFKPHRGLFILDMVCALIIAAVDLRFPISPAGAGMSCCPKAPTGSFFAVMAGCGWTLSRWQAV